MQTFNGIAMAVALLGATGAAAADAASEWVDLQDAKVRLVAASHGLDGDGAARLGLQIVLADGWKTYWREPGEAGLPPRVDWSGSENLAEARSDYPVPHRFESFGMTSLGYGDEVVFPIALRATDAAGAVAARLAVDFMVCERICVPMHAELALDLSANDNTSSTHAETIDRHAARVPGGPSSAGVKIDTVTVADGRLRVEAMAETPFRAPDLFVEAGGKVGFGAPSVELMEGGRRAVLHLPVSGDVAGERIVLTLVDGDRVLEQPWTLR